MFYLTTHSTHFIYGYMASDIWLRTIMIVRKETRCRHIGNSFRLAARVLLYTPSHREDNTYHGLCYTSRGAQAGTRNSSMGPPHEGSIRRPIAPGANALIYIWGYGLKYRWCRFKWGQIVWICLFFLFFSRNIFCVLYNIFVIFFYLSYSSLILVNKLPKQLYKTISFAYSSLSKETRFKKNAI